MNPWLETHWSPWSDAFYYLGRTFHRTAHLQADERRVYAIMPSDVFCGMYAYDRERLIDPRTELGS